MLANTAKGLILEIQDFGCVATHMQPYKEAFNKLYMKLREEPSLEEK